MERFSKKQVVVGIALISCLVYANTLFYPFVYDDLGLIHKQPAVTDPWDWDAVFGGHYWGPLLEQNTLYRPLTIWSLALNYRFNEAMGLEGTHPVGFRVLNILLHAGVSCLFFQFLTCLRVSPGCGLAAALLFATHPIHTEAVVSAVNRSELLAALFGLSFLILHRQGRWVLAMVCYFLSMWSKESGIAFFGLAVWMGFCLGHGSKRPYLGYGAMAVFWLSLRFLTVGNTDLGIPFLDNPLVDASVLERVLTAGRVQFDYLKLQVLPIGLSSDYSYREIPVLSSPFDIRLLGFVGLLIGALGLAWKTRRTHPLVGFAVVGYGILFSVTGNFLFPIGTIMGERLAYTPSLCFCLLVGYGVHVWFPKRILIQAILLLLACLGTVVRNQTWADSGTFYSARMLSAPNSARTHSGYGRWCLEKGDRDLAVVHLLKAVEILPTYVDAWGILGITYMGKDDLEAAIHAHQEGLRYAPNHVGINYNLGRAYHVQGNLEAAADAYLKAMKLDPDYQKAYVNLGSVRAEQGNLEAAEALWRRALELDPAEKAVLDNLRRLEQLRRKEK